jgi:hypothetical protein
MKLWLISQDKNGGYDSYDSAVVAADTILEARNMNPSDGAAMDWSKCHYAWCGSPDDVTVEEIGEAGEWVKQGVICASFNAG